MFVLPIVFILILGITDHNRQYNKELAEDRLAQLECERNETIALEGWTNVDPRAKAAIIRDACAPKKYK